MPAREVLRCDRGGVGGKSAAFGAVFGKPGPTLSLRDESPAGENCGGTPAGERARKRRAAQAAFLRGASRTPLACGQQTLRLPAFRFLFCRKRVDKRRFVDETAFTAPLQFVSSLGCLSSAKTRARKPVPRERYGARVLAGGADLTACDGLTTLSTAP